MKEESIQEAFMKAVNRFLEAVYALDESNPTSVKELNEARKVLEAWHV